MLFFFTVVLYLSVNIRFPVSGKTGNHLTRINVGARVSGFIVNQKCTGIRLLFIPTRNERISFSFTNSQRVTKQQQHLAKW